ncbi:hypothetical protein Adi01nite_25590 [Amorphoplanes digitatis]|nr:hypothetical protein Adi01nite_25590 [Actinoplanes digitatis]
MILGIAVLLAGLGGVAVRQWWHDRPPYGPEALSARATLRIVDQATANAAFKPSGADFAGDGDQIFLGQVAWDRPPRPQKGGSFRIVLLDKRSHLLPGHIAVTSARPDDVFSGSDAAMDIAQERYPWLRGAGTREINGSYWSTGDAVFAGVDASPVTFQIVLRPAREQTPPELAVPTAPAAVEDLLVALICVGPDGQVYWAQRLLH